MKDLRLLEARMASEENKQLMSELAPRIRSTRRTEAAAPAVAYFHFFQSSYVNSENIWIKVQNKYFVVDFQPPGID